MRALRIRPEGLVYEEAPEPPVGPGDVLVRVEAAGLNFADTSAFLNAKPDGGSLPIGGEAGGTVERVGDEVTDLKAGDRVCFRGATGAFAELVVIPADRTAIVPDGFDLKTASALMSNGLSAHYLVMSAYSVQAGDTVLVQAAAGGVGRLICQIAKMRGARVLGTVSTEAKAHAARDSGCDEPILYTETDFEAEVMRLTDGRGVDVVYDSVGAATFLKGLNCLRTRGTMVLFGESSGPVEPFDTRWLARCSLVLTRTGLNAFIQTTEELRARADDIFRWVTAGELKLHFHAEYPMEDALQAFNALRNRETIGKVVLIP
jgi:NADPH2:quinone reductase